MRTIFMESYSRFRWASRRKMNSWLWSSFQYALMPSKTARPPDAPIAVTGTVAWAQGTSLPLSHTYAGGAVE